MNKTLNITGWFGILILAIIALFPWLGYDFFGKSITYGFGLGDLFYAYLSIIAAISYSVLFSIKKIKTSLLAKKITTILIYLTVIFFCYSFSIGRGSEHQWNGEIFYP